MSQSGPDALSSHRNKTMREQAIRPQKSECSVLQAGLVLFPHLAEFLSATV